MAEGIKGVVVMAVATPAKVVELSEEAEEVAAAPEVVDLEVDMQEEVLVARVAMVVVAEEVAAGR